MAGPCFAWFPALVRRVPQWTLEARAEAEAESELEIQTLGVGRDSLVIPVRADTPIEEINHQILSHWQIPTSHQRLFCGDVEITGPRLGAAATAGFINVVSQDPRSAVAAQASRDLASAEERRRWSACRALRNCGGAAVSEIPCLVEALRDGSERVVKEAEITLTAICEALGRSGTTDGEHHANALFDFLRFREGSGSVACYETSEALSHAAALALVALSGPSAYAHAVPAAALPAARAAAVSASWPTCPVPAPLCSRPVLLRRARGRRRTSCTTRLAAAGGGALAV